jgi:hypothetical protein
MTDHRSALSRPYGGPPALRRFSAAGLLLWVVLLLAALVVPPAIEAGGIKVTGPAIEVSPPRFEFGDLPQEHIEHLTCSVHNAGSDLLLIRQISSDCGCTVAQIPDSSLAPGEKVDLSISFSTRHFSGPVRKTVTLVTNDPGSPKTLIVITAFVRAIVAVTPDELDFGRVPRGTSPAQTVTLRAAAVDTFKVLEVNVPEQTFSTELAREATADSTFYHLKITIRPDAPVGTFASTARVRTNIRSVAQLSIAMRGQIHGFFLADPGRLPLGQILEGQERTRTFQVVAQREGHHRVLGVRSSDERIQVALKPIEEGRRYEVAVTLPASAPPGKINAMLLVETDDPDQPEIRVEAFGTVRRKHS